MEDDRNKNKPETAQRIALLATKSLRSGPDSHLIRFVREFEYFFREVRKSEIYAVKGTHRALLSNGLLYDYKGLQAVEAGFQGLIELAAKVANKEIGLVIYLIDPRDPTSLFWETLAFKRECVVREIPFISTYKGAREWASLEWFKNRKYDRYFISEADEKAFLPIKANEKRKMDSVRAQGIALIAHDDKKSAMVEFAKNDYEFFNKFHERFATGTTGKYLNGAREQTWVESFNSGSKGGDVQIAEKIRKGKCHRVVFFEDPHISREHESAIQLLERAARIPELNIPFLHDQESAKNWVENLKYYQDESHTCYSEPLTLVQAYRHSYDIELVIADAENKDQLWDAILKKAADYIYGSIIQKAKERLAGGEKIYVGIPWGASINTLIAKMQELRGKVGEENIHLPSMRNVVVEPLVGIRGTADESREANYNSEQLAEFLGGVANTLYRVVFSENGGKSKKNNSSEGWDKLDLAVFTCSKVKKFLDSRETAPVPEDLYNQMNSDAAGEIIGIYLSKKGEGIETKGFTRTGISYKQLQSVAKKGGAILIAGVENDRKEIALAALSGGLVSVFVSDLDFARAILELDTSTEDILDKKANRSEKD